MAGEQNVLQSFLARAAESQWRQLAAEVQAGWVRQDLPGDPEDGGIGRDQLRVLVSHLRLALTNVESLIALNPWGNRPLRFLPADQAFSGQDFEQGISFQDRDQGQYREWAATLRRAADTLEQFVNDGN
jgi:hypothetical protein